MPWGKKVLLGKIELTEIVFKLPTFIERWTMFRSLATLHHLSGKYETCGLATFLAVCSRKESQYIK